MARPSKLPETDVDAWLAAHGEWKRAGEGDKVGLARAYKLKDFSAALGFVVRVGLVAEKRDHHPDVTLGYGKASVFWTTHDAGGVTHLDLELADASDAIFAG